MRIFQKMHSTFLATFFFAQFALLGFAQAEDPPLGGQITLRIYDLTPGEQSPMVRVPCRCKITIASFAITHNLRRIFGALWLEPSSPELPSTGSQRVVVGVAKDMSGSVTHVFPLQRTNSLRIWVEDLDIASIQDYSLAQNYMFEGTADAISAFDENLMLRLRAFQVLARMDLLGSPLYGRHRHATNILMSMAEALESYPQDHMELTLTELQRHREVFREGNVRFLKAYFDFLIQILYADDLQDRTISIGGLTRAVQKHALAELREIVVENPLTFLKAADLATENLVNDSRDEPNRALRLTAACLELSNALLMQIAPLGAAGTENFNHAETQTERAANCAFAWLELIDSQQKRKYENSACEVYFAPAGSLLYGFRIALERVYVAFQEKWTTELQKFQSELEDSKAPNGLQIIQVLSRSNSELQCK